MAVFNSQCKLACLSTPDPSGKPPTCAADGRRRRNGARERSTVRIRIQARTVAQSKVRTWVSPVIPADTLDSVEIPFGPLSEGLKGSG